MAQKKSSPAAGQRGPGSGIRIDSERPPIAQIAPKIQKNLAVRRSIRNPQATPDEVGQHVRAAYLQDRLAEMVTQAAVAQWLFSVEADDDALVAFEALVGNVREAAATARVFRDVHNARGEASHRAAMDRALAVHESEKHLIDEERCAE